MQCLLLHYCVLCCAVLCCADWKEVQNIKQLIWGAGCHLASWTSPLLFTTTGLHHCTRTDLGNDAWCMASQTCMLISVWNGYEQLFFKHSATLFAVNCSQQEPTSASVASWVFMADFGKLQCLVQQPFWHIQNTPQLLFALPVPQIHSLTLCVLRGLFWNWKTSFQVLHSKLRCMTIITLLGVIMDDATLAAGSLMVQYFFNCSRHVVLLPGACTTIVVSTVLFDGRLLWCWLPINFAHCSQHSQLMVQCSFCWLVTSFCQCGGSSLAMCLIHFADGLVVLVDGSAAPRWPWSWVGRKFNFASGLVVDGWLMISFF